MAMQKWALVCLAAGLCAAQQLDAPVLVWSDGVGAAGSEYELERTTRAQVGDFVGAAHADLTVVIAVPLAKWAEANKPALEERLRSKATKVFPFVELDREAEGFFDAAAVETVDAAMLQSRVEGFEKAHTATILSTVFENDWDTLDAQLAQLDRTLSERAGSYVIAVVGGSRSAVTRRLVDATAAPTAAPSMYPAGVHMTPDILTGVLVGFLFIFVILIGLSCIGAIQTPSQYSKIGPPSLKEW
ncbi:hypothetical protein M885DRAFT_530174 [Pelagophyceae sp. CCMP2097]|nr:hypothetical protein M885DRAFT_530174 [Pelagophyceae sp. CCMP2097]